jgi:hypothetical protein
MASSIVHDNIAFLKEEDSPEKSSIIPQATLATPVVKQEGHEDVEETTKFTLFPKVSSRSLTRFNLLKSPRLK